MRPTMANPDVHRAWRGHAGTWGVRNADKRAPVDATLAAGNGRRAPVGGTRRGGGRPGLRAGPQRADHRRQPRLEQLLGVAAGGLGGRTLPSLAYPPDEELANAAVRQVLSEGLDRCQVEGRWVRVFSRELVWGGWDLSLVRDRRGRPQLALALVRDPTALKRSQHQRRLFPF